MTKFSLYAICPPSLRLRGTVRRSFNEGVRYTLYATGCFLCILLCGCQNRPLYKDGQAMMGTFVEVISPDERAPGIVFAEIKRIENLLSKYNVDSEISRLNQQGYLAVSADTLYIIKKAIDFWKDSDGAFDITVAALVDLWGFTEKQYRLPKVDKIKEVLDRTGTDKIILHNDDNVIEFKTPGMKIDLGGIAKGYAVDRAVDKLKQAGVRSCLINAGGDIYCLGDKPRPFSLRGFLWGRKGRGEFGQPWRVAVQDPRGEGFTEYIKLRDRAVATSGDYEQYFLKEDKRYAHILDPQTGYPTDSGVASVTVIAPDCLTADALATAIMVLGKEKGESLAGKFSGVEVKIVEVASGS